MLIKTFNRLKLEDPIKGIWLVSNSRNGTVWCDASNIALSVVLEIDGNLVEDVAWLRKKHDFAHISVAELDAVLKDINMANQWEITYSAVIFDSVTVCTLLNSVINGDKKIRIH